MRHRTRSAASLQAAASPQEAEQAEVWLVHPLRFSEDPQEPEDTMRDQIALQAPLSLPPVRATPQLGDYYYCYYFPYFS